MAGAWGGERLVDRLAGNKSRRDANQHELVTLNEGYFSTCVTSLWKMTLSSCSLVSFRDCYSFSSHITVTLLLMCEWDVQGDLLRWRLGSTLLQGIYFGDVVTSKTADLVSSLPVLVPRWWLDAWIVTGLALASPIDCCRTTVWFQLETFRPASHFGPQTENGKLLCARNRVRSRAKRIFIVFLSGPVDSVKQGPVLRITTCIASHDGLVTNLRYGVVSITSRIWWVEQLDRLE